MGHGFVSEFLRIDRLTKRFPSSEKSLEVLEDLSLNINEGEFVTILGPSGCGKSTLLRCIGGFETPTGGSVLLRGQPVTAPSPNISMVFQTFDQLFPWKTVLQNVLMPLKINNKAAGKNELRDIAASYLELVGLSGFMNYYPHQLSGGMKQRVAIARSFAMKADVVLMDEPFASLDAQNRTVLQAELLKIWEKTKVTILFVTHNMFEAIILGSKLLVLDRPPRNIQMVVENTVPYTPGSVRRFDDPAFTALWTQLREFLYDGGEKTDVHAPMIGF